MITRIIKAKLKPEYRDEFLKYMATFLTQVKDLKNYHHADCFADMEEDFHYHIYTIWKTEGALNKFRKSEFNLEFKLNLNGWCEVPFVAWTVENVY